MLVTRDCIGNITGRTHLCEHYTTTFYLIWSVVVRFGPFSSRSEPGLAGLGTESSVTIWDLGLSPGFEIGTGWDLGLSPSQGGRTGHSVHSLSVGLQSPVRDCVWLGCSHCCSPLLLLTDTHMPELGISTHDISTQSCTARHSHWCTEALLRPPRRMRCCCCCLCRCSAARCSLLHAACCMLLALCGSESSQRHCSAGV